MTVDCETCKTPMHLTPYFAHKRSVRFCSRICARRSGAETNIEKLMRLALDALGIPYIQEYSLPRHRRVGLPYQADFFLPDANIDIEVDGTYWHQKKKDHDKIRDSFLESKGIHVLRFKDQDILTAPLLTALLFKRLLRG